MRYLTNKRRNESYEANHAAASVIYRRGAELLPPEYLICHQDADAVTKVKILAQAELLRRTRCNKRWLNS